METFGSVPAKLLLFGEHSVLSGSPALTLPLWDFSAQLKFPDTDLDFQQKTSNIQLQKFSHYLKKNPDWFDPYMDGSAFEKALENGLYLNSNIPEGYGLGSSASVCVAVYKAFGRRFPEDPTELRSFYSKMESFFHGKSSGIDPLAIHAGQPVIVDGKNICFARQKKAILAPEINTYLLDSHISRNASEMIATFQSELNDEGIKIRFWQDYISVLENLKAKILRDEPISWSDLETLSHLQLTYFHKLIPEKILVLWKEMLSSGRTCFKILGAGGGGYFLVFLKEEHEKAGEFSLIPIQL